MQTKSILMALSAMALVTACTNDETIEMNRGEGISLSAVAGKATRAGSEATTTNSIDNFHVYAFTQGLEYMNHDVTRIDDNTWTYGDTKFCRNQLWISILIVRWIRRMVMLTLQLMATRKL